MKPSSSVTFLFTAIESSTRHWINHPVAMRDALEKHNRILHESIKANDGHVFKVVDGAFYAAFARAASGVAAAVQVQRLLASQEWGSIPLRVRIALHTGKANELNDNYFGPAVSRASRLLSASHGGQILVSPATEDLARGHLPDDIVLNDLGEIQLNDIMRPERLFEVTAPGLRPEISSPHVWGTPHNRPPILPTSFIGRENEIQKVNALFAAGNRLVTLTGPGGIGKTRLSLKIAAELSNQYPHGACFVELAPFGDSEMASEAVARSLGLHVDRNCSLTNALTEYFSNRHFLIVLDHCDQIVASISQLIGTVLSHCPNVAFLASSWEALGLPNEIVFAVPALSIPDQQQPFSAEILSQYDAVRLLVDRARIASPVFDVTPQNAPGIIRICSRLDGIPLAIELASAQMKTLSVEQVAERLEDRARLQNGGKRAYLPRQQTVRILLDGIYDLLTSAEQILFRRLAVFPGRFTQEAVEIVIPDEKSGVSPTPSMQPALALDKLHGLLNTLVVKLLVSTRPEPGGHLYYYLDDTIRQYALNKLNEADSTDLIQNRHLLYYMELAERAELELRGRDQREWFIRIDNEQNNLRSAMKWALENDMDSGLRLASALWWYWRVRGYWQEGFGWLKKFLDATDHEKTSQRGLALARAGALAWLMDDNVEASCLASESLVLCEALRDQPGVAMARLIQGLVARHGSLEEAVRLLNLSLRLFREQDNAWGAARTLYNLGSVTYSLYDWRTAREHYQESLNVCRLSGDLWSVATALNSLGLLAYTKGDAVAALSLYLECLVVSQQVENHLGVSTSLQYLGEIACWQGDYVEAALLFNDSQAISLAINNRAGILRCAIWLGRIERRLGHFDAAYHWLEETLRRARQKPEGARELIGDALHELGETARSQGLLGKAQRYYLQAVALRRENPTTSSLLHSLEAFAGLYVARGLDEPAVRLMGAAASARQLRQIARMPVEQATFENDIRQLRDRLGADRFQQVWQHGQELSLDEALALL